MLPAVRRQRIRAASPGSSRTAMRDAILSMLREGPGLTLAGDTGITLTRLIQADAD